MKNFLAFFLSVFLTQIHAQKNWASLGPSQDSTFFNKKSPGSETNALGLIENAPDGTLYRLYQKYCNFYQCNNPVTVLKLINNKWLPIGSFASSQKPAFKVDNTGNPYLVTAQSNSIYCYKFLNNGWQSAGSFTVNAFGNANVTVKLKFDKANSPYILYSNAGDTNKLTLKKLVGSNWLSVGQNGFAPCVSTQINYYVPNLSSSFDFTVDSNLNVYVGSVIKYGNNNKLNIYWYNGTNWQLKNNLGANTATLSSYVSLQGDNYNIPYCCYLDSNNNYSILSGLQSSPTSVFTNSSYKTYELKFVFDTLNQIVPYTVFYNDTYSNQSCSFYKWTGNLQTMQLIGNLFSFDLNTRPFFIITSKHKPFTNENTADNFRSWTTLFLNATNNEWQILGKEEAGVVNTRTNQSTIKFDKSGAMYICFTDNINLGVVSVLKFQNNNFSWVGSQNINNGNSLFWQFELDNNGIPTLAYANLYDTSNVIVKKFDGNNWVKLGNTNFHSNFSNSPKLFYDKNNNLYLYNYNGINRENTIHEFVNNEWKLITGNDLRFKAANIGDFPFIIDTNNVINTIYGTHNGTEWCNAIQKFNTEFTPDYATCTKNYLFDFAIDKSTNTAFSTWVDNRSQGKLHIQKLTNGSWNILGDTLEPAVNDYPKNSTHLILDSLGNPYYLASSYADTSRLSLYYLKNNHWKKLGNTRVINYETSNYNAAIYNNKLYVIYSNKGAWIRTIDLPALASINSAVDSCSGNLTKINVNISDAQNYQWQNQNKNGFINISDNSTYSGTNSRQLKIQTSLSDLSQQQFRCIVLKSSGYSDTTNYITFSCHYLDSVKAIPSLILFPNPTTSIFTIEAKKNINHYEISDVLGKTLINQPTNLSTRINVDMSIFPVGVYFVRIDYGDKEKKVFKLMKH